MLDLQNESEILEIHIKREEAMVSLNICEQVIKEEREQELEDVDEGYEYERYKFMNTQSLGIAQTNVEIKLPGQSFPREHLSLNRCKSEIGSDQLTNANPLWGFGYSLIPEKNSQIHRRASTAAFLSVTSRPAREAIVKANTSIFQELISSTPATVGREFSASVYPMASNVPQPLPHQYSRANTQSWNPMWSPRMNVPVTGDSYLIVKTATVYWNYNNVFTGYNDHINGLKGRSIIEEGY